MTINLGAARRATDPQNEAVGTVTLTPLAGQGTVPIGHWYYAVIAVFEDGTKSVETYGDGPSASIGGIRVEWDAVDGAESYLVLGRYNIDEFAASTTNTFVIDDGSAGNIPISNDNYRQIRLAMPSINAGTEFGAPFTVAAGAVTWVPLAAIRNREYGWVMDDGASPVRFEYELGNESVPPHILVKQPGSYFVSMTALSPGNDVANPPGSLYGNILYPDDGSGWFESNHVGFQPSLAVNGSQGPQLITSKVLITAGVDESKWGIAARIWNRNATSRTINDLVLTITTLALFE